VVSVSLLPCVHVLSLSHALVVACFAYRETAVTCLEREREREREREKDPCHLFKENIFDTHGSARASQSPTLRERERERERERRTEAPRILNPKPLKKTKKSG